MEKNFLENEKLVYGVMRRKYRWVRENEREDVEQAGRLGLMKATKNFRTEKGVAFSTYAERCIENAINQYFRRAHAKGERVVESISSVIGRLESDDVTWEDVLEDEGQRVEDVVERKELRLMLYKEASEMKASKSEIIRLWLDGYNGAEIGNKLGVSRQRVNQVVQEYRRTIKRKLAKAEMLEYVK